MGEAIAIHSRRYCFWPRYLASFEETGKGEDFLPPIAFMLVLFCRLFTCSI